MIRPIVTAALLLSVPAFAQGTQSDTVKPLAEKKICRRGEVPTGSMMPAKRTCHTAAEWAAIDKQVAAASGSNANGRFTQDPGMSNIPTGTVN